MEISKIHVMCFSLHIKPVPLTEIKEKAYGVKCHLLQVNVPQCDPLNFAPVRYVRSTK